jgi:hypothetical protein
MADYWMKLYIEILDDPKMATLPDRLWRRIVELFLVAKKLNTEGHLPETRQIAWLLRMNPDDLEMDLKQIAPTGIVVQELAGWFIPKFSERQAAVPAAERKRLQREKEKARQYYGNVTPQSRNVTQINRLTEAEAEAEAEGGAATMPANALAVRLYSEITGHLAIPARYRDDAVGALELIAATKENPAAYLKPFWDTWLERKYSASNCSWLTDWAVTGKIPKQGKNNKQEVDWDEIRRKHGVKVEGD